MIEKLIPEVAADRLLVELFGADAYAVGGRVRDAAIAHVHGGSPPAPKDLDYIITNHTLPQVYACFEKVNYHVETVGASFAVLKVRVGDDTIDVSLPRRERSTGPGHKDFAVEFGPEVSIEEDASRRDFTINSLSYNLKYKHVLASAQAWEDIRCRQIRMINNNTFGDDPLRLLRAVQFASRLEFEIEPSTLRRMKVCALAVKDCSAERIRDEIVKIVEKSPRPSFGSFILAATGLIDHIRPELNEMSGVEQNTHHAYDVWQHTMESINASAAAGHDLTTRMAVLLHDIGKPRTAAPRADGEGNSFYGHETVGAEMAQAILSRLRFPDEFIGNVVRAVREHMYATRESDDSPLSDTALRRFIRRVGLENVERQFEVRYADAMGHGPGKAGLAQHNFDFQDRVRAMITAKPALSVKDLPLRGQDVIAILIREGAVPSTYKGDKMVGVILDAMLEAVIQQPEQNTRDALLAHCAWLARDLKKAA